MLDGLDTKRLKESNIGGSSASDNRVPIKLPSSFEWWGENDPRMNLSIDDFRPYRSMRLIFIVWPSKI